MKKWFLTGLFTLFGGVIGYAYYLYMNCGSGACGLGFSPIRSVICMAFIGWALAAFLLCDRSREESG